MAVNDCKQDDFNPYEGMDSDNINYHHSVNYDAIRDLLNSLPPGWKRLDPKEMSPGQAPYVHEPTGETSWKNPNLDKVMSVSDETHERKRKENESGGASSKQVKRLRLMLQAGAPLGAVEQKAKLEGIDMSLVLSPSDGGGVGGRAVVSDDEGAGAAAGAAIPETLAKKYRRMVKAGVPVDRVQQMASVEAGASPQQVLLVVQGGGDDKRGGPPEGDPRTAKFLKMQKAGIPLAAIRRAAQLQGIDAEELREALGVEGGDGKESTESKSEDEPGPKKETSPRSDLRMAKFLKMQKAGIPLGGIENAAKLQGINVKDLHEALGINRMGCAGDTGVLPSKPSVEPLSASLFSLRKGAVAFPSSRQGPGSFPLTDLIRKMAQTVQKTSQFNMGSMREMVVDETTLYDALGALKGVQYARDEYNSTIGVKDMVKEVVHSKRHGFAEMAASIGMTLPNDSILADIEGLDSLIKHIEAVNRENLDRSQVLLKDGYYDFDSIHTLYEPGSYVIAKHAGGSGVDCFCQVVWHRYTQGRTISGKSMKYFQLCCRFIVPVGGGKSTFAEVVEGIEMFEGRRSLSASSAGTRLAFVPPMDHELKHLFQSRGEMYNRILGGNNGKAHCYMQYEKGCFFQKRGGGSFNSGKSSVALATSGRIVVDFDAASDNGHSISIGRDDLIDGIRMKLKEYKLHLRSVGKSKGGSADGGETKGAASVRDMILFSRIPVEYLALVWPTTVGFSLTSKSWGDVTIDGLEDITFDPHVFDRLVLPHSRKRMIKALVKHTNASGFHDIVEGKGEGTVFLLYGQPGVGKTLTAEAIAETLYHPLYSVSMGTLGTTADELERRLGEILQLSARWDALVLLDEADSFLEARDSNSPLERNAMVSVMLRLVEYHRGILFLTSNRVDSLDPAFQTRITLALHYEALDLDARAKVWENLLLKSNQCLDSLELKVLAETELNGREIKNALRLAMALAADEGGVLSQELLLETAAVVHDNKAAMKVDWNSKIEIRTPQPASMPPQSGTIAPESGANDKNRGDGGDSGSDSESFGEFLGFLNSGV